MSVLRASSLAAVTNFVWSMRDRPCETAFSRTNWRSRTICSSLRIGSVSGGDEDVGAAVELKIVMESCACGRQAVPPFERSAMPFLHVQRRAYARKREAEFDERDRDRRLHADDDRLGIEHARHGGRVADHASDERIDHVERGNVDQDAARAVFHDAARQIVLQREREPVVHVDLNGDEQEPAHRENRNAFHRLKPRSVALRSMRASNGERLRHSACSESKPSLARLPREASCADPAVTDLPVRCSATTNADASVALVVTFVRFTPR